MNSFEFSSTGRKSHQKGIAILAIAVILLLVSTLLVFAVGKSSINEQRVVGTDLRVKDIYAAALAGLEMGHNWLDDTNNVFLSADTDGDGDIDANDDPLILNQAVGDDTFGNTVTVSLRSLTPLDAYPLVVEVISTAMMNNDTHVTKTVSAKYSITTPVGGGSALNGPPLIVEECVLNTGGTGSVWPNPDGYSIGTINGEPADPGCIDSDGLDLNGGTVAEIDDTFQSAFVTLFGPGYTEDDLIADAANNDHIIYVDDNDGGDWVSVNNWQTDLCTTSLPTTGNNSAQCATPGTPGTTYILYFDSSADCPALNAGVTIYGIVFYETGVDTNGDGVISGAEVTCTNTGWGSGDVYGNVVFSGDMDQLTGNGDIYYLDGNCDGDCTVWELYDTTRQAQQIPGTFKDFGDWSAY